jgi:radical SAM protein with 4Fe4S-binding SPASM domain
MDDRFLVGNVLKTDLGGIERSRELADITARCIERTERIPQCSACDWKSLCQSACPALSYLEHGTFEVADDFCSFRRRLYNNKIFEIAEARRAVSDF